jgi:hypothetical protein
MTGYFPTQAILDGAMALGMGFLVGFVVSLLKAIFWGGGE